MSDPSSYASFYDPSYWEEKGCSSCEDYQILIDDIAEQLIILRSQLYSEGPLNLSAVNNSMQTLCDKAGVRAPDTEIQIERKQNTQKVVNF